MAYNATVCKVMIASPADMHIFPEAIRCYKRDLEEYRRRVAEDNSKDVDLVGAPDDQAESYN